MQVETFIRMPQRVVAIQWYPHKTIPEVTNIYKQIDSSDGSNPIRYISSGKLTIDGRPWQVDPADYVIYDVKTMKPIQAITEAVFLSTYMSTKAFCLCSDCQERADQAITPPKIETLDQVEQLLIDGRGPIPVSDNGNITLIYTVEQLNEIRKVLIEKSKSQEPTM